MSMSCFSSKKKLGTSLGRATVFRVRLVSRVGGFGAVSDLEQSDMGQTLPQPFLKHLSGGISPDSYLSDQDMFYPIAFTSHPLSQRCFGPARFQGSHVRLPTIYVSL